MIQRLAGRGQAAAVVVLLALFSTIDVATKAAARWLQRCRESEALAALMRALAPSPTPRLSSIWLSLALGLALSAYMPESGGIGLAVAISTNWPDQLDSRFAVMFNDRFRQLADMIATFFTIKGPGDTPTKDTLRVSQAGAFGDVPEFTGTVTYDDAYQGYDSTITPAEYASGFQIERKLFEDDLYGIMDTKPSGLATAYQRTRQTHAAQVFNNATSVDTTWNNNTENVALASNSHTTTASGVSTASGFDNLSTAAFSATNLAAARIQMVNFRGDRAERIAINPDMCLYPPDLYQTVFEVLESLGNPETTTNAANVHQGRFRPVEWNYLTDTNNWALIDSVLMKDSLFWYDRTPMEFAMVESFDELIGKWRLYARYGGGHNDWRWLNYSQVS